jgi:hypothetical protein
MGRRRHPQIVHLYELPLLHTNLEKQWTGVFQEIQDVMETKKTKIISHVWRKLPMSKTNPLSGAEMGGSSFLYVIISSTFCT